MTKTYLKYRSRVIITSGLIVFCWVGLSVRLFQIQIIDGEELRLKGHNQSMIQKPLKAVRGNIFDRDNAAFTRNIIHYSFGVHPALIDNKEEFAEWISTSIDGNKDKYLKKLNSSRSFEYLERNLQRKHCEKLLINKPQGLIVERDSRRYYPHGNLASQVLGFVDLDDKGIAGIEQKFNSYLAGKPGWIVRQMSGRGYSMYKTNLPQKTPVDGASIQLTIDLDYQAILQEELAAQLELTNAISAMGLILNPQTGDILAMATVPDFDPNYPGRGEISWQRNKVITDQFEPGSTFKIVPLTAAVDQNTVSLWQEFNCENGSYTYAGHKIRDWDDFGLLTMPQIMENSSNVGVIKIAETLSQNNLYHYSRDLGFGMHTHISLAGEQPGTLHQVSEWSKISLAEVSLGHEVAVTALQLGMAYAAIANGGFLMKPRLLKQIITSSGKKVYAEKPEVIRKVATKEVMDIMTDMLCRVVETGTGTKAAINGWSVAGKTGTAQKFIDGQYSNKKFISNFVGFLPAANPQLVGVIILDEPKIGYHWGGHGAAPVFHRVMERIINMDDSIRLLKPQTIENDHLLVQERLPLPHTSDNTVAKPVVLSNAFSVVPVVQKNNNDTSLPDVRGMSLRRARTVLRQIGLRTYFKGSGKVIWQSPKPGTIVADGSICTIGLK